MRWVLLLVVCVCTSHAMAQDMAETPWMFGLAVGNFDVDTDVSDDPHLNEVNYGLMFGYQASRFWAVDAEVSRIEVAREYDDFGVLTAFGGYWAGLSARAIWPLAEDFSAYARLGVAAFELDPDSRVRESALDARFTQPFLGVGVRGKKWFVEYLSHGEKDDLYLEQLRFGIEARF